MKKIWTIKNLDCATCAAKLEEGVQKIEGVKSVHVSFLTQKMTAEIIEEKEKEVIDAIRKTCKKIEPDCEIIEKEETK